MESRFFENHAKKYLLSYSACAIRRADCVTLAKTYLSCGDWREVRRQAVEDDTLLIKSESSRKRISSELVKRLNSLSDDEVAALVSIGGSRGQGAVCWMAICRTYDFIAKFVTDCMAERWIGGTKTLTDGVYESFVSEEAEVHPELVTISPATQDKLRSQLFTMLREMEFVDKNGAMMGYVMPSDCQGVVTGGDLRWFPTVG